MNKEEIRHFKAMLRQGSLRHMNIILDDKFQSELLKIIKDYEKQQLENKKYKEVIDKANKLIDKCIFPAYDEQSDDFQESLYKINEVLKEVE